MTDRIRIRRAEAKDIPQLTEIFQKDLGYGACMQETVAAQFAKLDEKREAVFVAATETDDRAIGVIHVELYNTLYFPTLANILGLAVSSCCRGRGTGSLLLTAAEEWAAREGAAFMRVNSGESRTEAHAFYRKRGYTDEKEQKRFLKELSSPCQQGGKDLTR